jgi:hypothetical protein
MGEGDYICCCCCFWSELKPNVYNFMSLYCVVFRNEASNLDKLPCNLIWGFTQKIDVDLVINVRNKPCVLLFICCLVRQFDKAVVSMGNGALSRPRPRRACRVASLGSSIMPD